MVSPIQKRTRSERVATLELPPGLLEKTWGYLQRGDVLLRLGLCLLTAAVLWAITGAWAPPFGYRKNYTPDRDITARVEFQTPDITGTENAKEQAKRTVRHVYEQDIEPLVQLRAALQNRIVQITSAKTFEELDNTIWQQFFAQPDVKVEQQKELYDAIHAALPNQDMLATFEKAVTDAMASMDLHGLLKELTPDENSGNQVEIVVFPKGQPQRTQTVPIADVLIRNAEEKLKRNLAERIASPEIAARVYDWLKPQLPTTLTKNTKETNAAIEKAVEEVEPKVTTYFVGNKLAPGGVPLTQESLTLLGEEYKAMLAKQSALQRTYHSLATLGMFIALSTLCGVYVLCYEPKILRSFRRFATMLALVVITVGFSLLVSESYGAESIPLLLFGMTIAIAYHQELALLFSAAVALIIVIALGHGLSEFIIFAAAVATAIMLVGRIRSRRKLIYVGLCVGIVAFATTVGVETLDEQPFKPTIQADATNFAVWAVVAGFLMTGLLPFIENLFGVQTDISLLELGDVAHPLLQELVRRAPGTYNHSINVASLAEAAAESIGARGLLVRVGAYFHDIGKMLKPGYFAENQGHDANRHESLVPAMSTLIIIAHIKDGADLARQHHLPQAIIDFIQQHHGTTLVEYFFHRANEQSEADPDRGEVEESAFRYPGPKPQTKEAGVLMIADAVESACRTLVEPTPARIESLVHDIAMKRLLDGQFDSCGLTLQELATIEDSLVKSLTAVYHGRVKYPDQRTA